jgi:thiol-disulfide isomerase/thioredoxin|tara:strand:- start:740 stop:1120 length:381 start_codon:yes stop_codon:yes gene_type:complete
MNYYYGIAWLLGLLLFQSPLYTQSVNLDSFEKIQLVKLENCAVVQVNASWNYKNRLAIEKLKDCYIAEVDLSNRQIGAVIQKEWKVKVVPTIIIFKNGTEVKRFEAGVSMKLDEKSILESIRKEIK